MVAYPIFMANIIPKSFVWIDPEWDAIDNFTAHESALETQLQSVGMYNESLSIREKVAFQKCSSPNWTFLLYLLTLEERWPFNVVTAEILIHESYWE